MDLSLLSPGHKIRTRGGSEAEVLSETKDGGWIRVRYLDGDDPLFGGTEDLTHRDEVEAMLGVAGESAWGERVTVVLHRVPESEEHEGGYEMTTMTGVPHNVAVTGSDRDSAEAALDHLLDGLQAFGLVGVGDATHDSRMRYYEVELSD